MTPEHAVAAAMTKKARTAGLYIRKCRWDGRVGCPDYLVLKNGRAFFIETKAPGENPRRSQLAEFGQILKAGCPVFVVDSESTAEEVIQAICEANC